MTKKKTDVRVSSPQFDGLIYTVRGVRVMLDRDLAEIYGVATRVFNQAVKRNRIRFPEDFMFQLTRAEVESIRLSRSQNVTLKRDANLPSALLRTWAKPLRPVLCPLPSGPQFSYPAHAHCIPELSPVKSRHESC